MDLGPGFVKLLGVMGDDYSIAQAARMSYGLKALDVEEVRRIIRETMRLRHTSPYEMVEFKFHVKVSMDTWRQWIRHRTASVNEKSTRYCNSDCEMLKAQVWRGVEDSNLNLSAEEEELHAHAVKVYRKRLEVGVVREQARKDLPLSTFTEAIWKIDLHNLFHFLELRLNPAAQLEIRSYAKIILEIIRTVCPIAVEMFEIYRLNAMILSSIEVGIIAGRIEECVLNTREREAFHNKCNLLGVLQ